MQAFRICILKIQNMVTNFKIQQKSVLAQIMYSSTALNNY